MLRIYNSLTRKIEDFKPVNPHSLNVGMYTCGPTVYDFAHIGNFRTYTTADLLLRVLQHNGYTVKYVMNITDVGHLTGDNQGDADLGEDRMEKSARREGKSAWEVAAFYTDAFLQDFKSLNLIEPTHLVKATDHIKDQIDLVKRLEEKGFTYQISDGIYFDTSRYKEYGKLSNLDEIKEGARVEVNPEKRHPRDFALWKFSRPDEQRHMEWDSPWGVGFPGWHIECSAMAMKYLGSSFDIHVGGIDLRETHHPNEIAQSEAATGEEFVRYWVHCAFVLVQGERMSKSKENNYKLYDLEKEGFDPLSLRYLYLQTHYRQEMNFTYPALEAAQKALNRLREFVIQYDVDSDVQKIGCVQFEEDFSRAINDDLNMPQALSILWNLVRSDLPNSAKIKSILLLDKVLGLDLKNAQIIRERSASIGVPENVKKLIQEREELRKKQQYSEADIIRNRIRRLGFEIEDSVTGTKVKKTRRSTTPRR